MTDKKQIEIKRGTGVMADLLNKEMDSLIKSYKCGDCVHLPLCMAQKGGVNLGLASENDCMYYQPKLPENSVVLTREEYTALINEFNALQHKYNDICDRYRLCKDENETIKQYAVMVRKETARELFAKIFNDESL